MRGEQPAGSTPSGKLAGPARRYTRAWAVVAATLMLCVLAPARAQGESEPGSTTSTTSTTVPPGVTTTLPPTTTTPSPPGTEPALAPLPPANPAPPLSDQEQPPPAPPPPPAEVAAADAAGRAQAELARSVALAAFQTAQSAEAGVLARFTVSSREVNEGQARLNGHTESERALADELNRARGQLRALGVGAYVNGRSGPAIHYVLNAQDGADLVNRWHLVASAANVQRSVVAGYGAARQAASNDLEAEALALESASAVHSRVLTDLAAAQEEVRRRGAEAENRGLLLDRLTLSAPVGPSDIPRLFLDAYRRAASTLEQRAPGCRVSANAIAGVGRIESNHGRVRRGVLALNGDVLPRIVGIQLDGTRSTSLISDTDGGQLDGDAVYDRAVGPMQFIPGTWARFGQDGNGDGKSDPNNVYDAALGAATYLCRAVPAGGLDTEGGLRPALFSYNHSSAYVDRVLSWIRVYDLLAGQMPLAAGP